ncbi:Cytochrome c oxidase assembly factor 6 [Talaromyces pinophilus]|nr:Cytochrome c oxidase assembly factor 6 [Talaromyces pinophilus]
MQRTILCAKSITSANKIVIFYIPASRLYIKSDTMSWFSFGSSSAGPQSAKASDGGRIAPDRSSREVCYNGRDLFFSCLDRNDILDAIKHDSEARKKCGKEIAEFESACSKAWVKYFKEKRVMEYNRDQTIAKIQKEDAEKAAAEAKAKAR